MPSLPNLSASWRPKLSHPLNRGLISLSAFAEGGGVPMSYGGPGGYTGPLTSAGTPSWAARVGSSLLGGRSVASLASSGDDWRLPTGVIDWIPAARVTYAFIRKRGGTSNANSLSFGYLDGTTTPRRAGAHSPYSDGVIYWDFGGASGVNRLTWSGYSASVEVETWVFVAGPLGSAIYFNGLQKASQSNALSRTQAVGGVGVNTGNNITTASDPNNMLLFGIWNAEWTEAEAAQFYREPYALLEDDPDTNFTYVNAVAGGGSFQAAWAANANFVVSTGARVA